MRMMSVFVVGLLSAQAAFAQGQEMQLKCVVESPAGKKEFVGQSRSIDDNRMASTLNTLPAINVGPYVLNASVSFGKTFTNLDSTMKPQLMVVLHKGNPIEAIRQQIARGFDLEAPLTQPIEAGDIFFSEVGRLDYSCGIVPVK